MKTPNQNVQVQMRYNRSGGRSDQNPEEYPSVSDNRETDDMNEEKLIREQFHK
jgi:hypothetical protein